MAETVMLATLRLPGEANPATLTIHRLLASWTTRAGVALPPQPIGLGVGAANALLIAAVNAAIASGAVALALPTPEGDVAVEPIPPDARLVLIDRRPAPRIVPPEANGGPA